MAQRIDRFLVIADSDKTVRSLACGVLMGFLKNELHAEAVLAHAAPEGGPEQAALVRLSVDPDAEMAHSVDKPDTVEAEEFHIRANDEAGLPRIDISARAEAGLLYGVEEAMAQFRLHRGFPVIDKTFSPAWAVRGMKGLHWNPQDYLSVLDFLPSCKFNYLMLCYGMTPEHCRRFRDPYSEEHREAIARIVQGCKERFVTVCVAVNPSLRSVPPARYSGDEDLQIVVDKLRASYDLGVRHFTLALDDISLDLQRSEDRATYRNLGEAHVDFTKRLRDALLAIDSDNRLTLCPTTYFTNHARAYPDYARAIAEGVPDDVELFWTGPDWNSVSVTYEDACEYAELAGRKPFLWLNYPVNDYLRPQPWRLVLAPTTMRCTRLPNAVTGVIANPMRQVEASKLPLWSIGRYCWDPAAYDPEASLEEACAVVAAEHNGSAEILYAIVAAYVGAYNPLMDLASALTNATPCALRQMEERLQQAARTIRQLLPALKAELGEVRLYNELKEGFGRFCNFADAFTAWRCTVRLSDEAQRHDLSDEALADASSFARLSKGLFGTIGL
ncbi:MAG: beta-N-acetylglucosaminidase domain-containing protein [Clostridia bacterium]|nr:beta-N-acetylglucosaminidase domain-containing protein [Clostridia bacterium]